MKSGENGLIGKGDNNYGNNKPLIHKQTTMTQTEAIRTIAEYDGWEFTEHQPIKGGWLHRKVKSTTFIDTIFLDEMDYATNIASLYFVAGRVAKELEQPKNVISGLARTEIKRTLLTFSPDLTPLLMAVADGVTLLKTYNNG